MNRSKALGTSAESAIAKALIEEGWPHVERRALAGSLDKGDIAGIPGICVEVKNCGTTAIPAWLKEVEAEKSNSKADIGVVWHKIRGRGDPRDWAVTMTGSQFIEILKKLGYHPEAGR